MKRALIAGLLALASSPALAADFAVKAAPVPALAAAQTWTGFYLGINGGGAWSRGCWDMNGALIFGFSPALHEGCNNSTGAVIGGQVGYRHQVGSWVFGLEAQGDWANLKGSHRSQVFDPINAILPAGVSIDLINTTKINAIGMVTGQVGYTIAPTLLWYVKGGAAVTDNEYKGALSLNGVALPPGITNPLLTDSAKEIKFGGVVGTGLDWMFAPGWTIGVDYAHGFMGRRNVGFALTGTGFTVPAPLLAPGMPTRNDSISQDFDIVTARLGYKF